MASRLRRSRACAVSRSCRAGRRRRSHSGRNSRVGARCLRCARRRLINHTRADAGDPLRGDLASLLVLAVPVLLGDLEAGIVSQELGAELLGICDLLGLVLLEDSPVAVVGFTFTGTGPSRGLANGQGGNVETALHDGCSGIIGGSEGEGKQVNDCWLSSGAGERMARGRSEATGYIWS